MKTKARGQAETKKTQSEVTCEVAEGYLKACEEFHAEAMKALSLAFAVAAHRRSLAPSAIHAMRVRQIEPKE